MIREETRERILRRQGDCADIKRIIVERLDLPIDPDWITDDQPLFGRGLELDSVDALELVAALEYELDVSVEPEAVGVFGSINALVDHLDTARRLGS